MNFKEITATWLRGLRVVGLILLGFPTVSFTWHILNEMWSPTKQNTRMMLICAAEDWLEKVRWAALFLLGFPTLGYAWVIIGRLDSIMFFGLRKKIEKAEK